MAEILLVEDDRMISRMMSMRLEMQGHHVTHAYHGQEAVTVVATGDFDIILMDMNMPVMDGHEATRQIRAAGFTRQIIAVTASVQSIDSQKAIESGCDSFIAKPIGEDFEERIAALLAS